jgi:dipeptidyl aminopeptidase/acylaminoacyl peptidase
MAEQQEQKPDHIVYRLPNMEQVTVREDIAYKTADGSELTMNVYYPINHQRGTRLPAVLFVHGDAPPEYLKGIKDHAQYTGWGQLTAASGLIAVTFSHRSSEGLTRIYEVVSDIDDLIRYVRENSESLSIDADTLCIWSCSAGSPYGLRAALREDAGFVKCIVSYYGLMDFNPYVESGEEDAPKLSTTDLEEFSAVQHLKKKTKAVAPILIARAGLDHPSLNQTIDRFVMEALTQNIDVHVINYREGHHGFDVRDDNERSREIMQATLDFMKAHLNS